MLFVADAFVAVAVLVQIPGLVAGMVVVFAGNLFLATLVTVAVLIEVSRFVTGMIVMLTGFFLGHHILRW